MRHKNLGIDPKTGVHNATLTHVENRFLALLWTDHVGKLNAIPADELAVAFDCALRGIEASRTELRNRVETLKQSRSGRSTLNALKREVRHLQLHLLFKHRKIPVFSKEGIHGGYYIGDTKEEGDDFFARFRKRGLTGILKASRGKESVMVKIVRQLTFEFEDLMDSSGLQPKVRISKTETDVSMAFKIVDSFLEKMTNNPEKYAEDLRKLRERHHAVLMPRGLFEQLQEQAKKLAELVSGIS